jgi:hypothetical protein
MKNWKSVLTTFAFLCLISEAQAQFNQYTLMRRGQVSAYDSSVNIEIGEYRKIRAKVLTADSVYNAFMGERYLNASALKSYIGQIFTKDEIIRRHEDTILAKDATIAGLKTTNEESLKLLKSFRLSPVPAIDTGLKVGGGIVIGIIIRSLIKK